MVSLVLAKTVDDAAVIAEDHGGVMDRHPGDGLGPTARSWRPGTPGIAAQQAGRGRHRYRSGNRGGRRHDDRLGRRSRHQRWRCTRLRLRGSGIRACTGHSRRARHTRQSQKPSATERRAAIRWIRPRVCRHCDPFPSLDLDYGKQVRPLSKLGGAVGPSGCMGRLDRLRTVVAADGYRTTCSAADDAEPSEPFPVAFPATGS